MQYLSQRLASKPPPGRERDGAGGLSPPQRERLLDAAEQLVAAHGVAGVSVEALVKRAGVSSVTFYKQFAGKRECMLAAHRELGGRLLEEVDSVRAGEDGPAAAAQAALRTALALCAANPPSARLLTIEILAAGPEGVERHDAMVAAFAERLDADWVRAAGILALVGRRVVAGEADRLPACQDELAATLRL